MSWGLGSGNYDSCPGDQHGKGATISNGPGTGNFGRGESLDPQARDQALEEGTGKTGTPY